MEELVTFIPFENHTPIDDNTNLFVLYNDGVQRLRAVNNKFYRSFICEKNTVVKSRELLSEFNDSNISLPKMVTVLILINDSVDELVFDKINDVEHFVRYLQFAEKQSCDLSILENDVALDGIFVNIARSNEKLWIANKILLTNINIREFQKMHFTVDPAAPVVAAANYPNFDIMGPANKKYTRNVRFEPIKTSICENLCSQEIFNSIIEYLSKLNLNDLIRRILKTFLLSFEYCQLAMKCPYLKELVYIYPELSKCMIYAMRLLYLEEKSRFGNFVKAPTTDKTDRFIFKLDDTIGLPYFPKYTPDNPYFVEPGMGSGHKQQLSLPSFIKGTRGVYDKKIAMERLTEFTGGVLENIQWNYGGVQTALCGSTIPAVFIKNPLEEYISHDSYFQEYYPACNTSRKVYTEEVEEKKSLTQHYILESDSDTVVESESEEEEGEEDGDKLIDLSVSDKLKNAYDHLIKMRKDHGVSYTKYSVTGENRRRIRKHSTDDAEYEYDMAKSNYEAEMRFKSETIELADVELDGDETQTPLDMDNELTNEEKNWDKFTDIDLMVETDDYELFDEIANAHFEAVAASSECNTLIQPYIKLLYTENKYKYKIYGLPRSIEIFMVNSIPGVISKFHMAPVRAWWDGKDLNMLPTFITAAMTSVCYDLRWISCSKDLRDIVLKYFQRGFSQVLNKEECVNLISYVNATPKWPEWIIPVAWQGWRAYRWMRRPIYYDAEGIFNPSINKYGIYHKLNGCEVHGVQPIEYSIPITEYKGPNYPKPTTRSLWRKKILSPNKMPNINF